MTAAAIQMDARLGDVAGNLARAELLVREAFRRGAQWVVLPEFFTSPVGYHFALRHVALPPDGPATRLLCDLAREYHGVVGGSFITAHGGDATNRFVLAGPDGVLGQHDKDQPTMWENAYYIGGHDDGLIQSPLGPVGAAVCWELVRTRTVARLRGRARMIVGGSCWWTLPQAPLLRTLWSGWDAQNREIMRSTPARFARLVGAPVIHAAHCAHFECQTPGAPFLRYSSHYLGEAQIVAADGSLLARRLHEEGEGVILARVRLGAEHPAEPLPQRFWIPDLPAWARAMWAFQNAHGTREYQRVKAAGGFGWQQRGWESMYAPADARQEAPSGRSR
ncbi:MAG: carbon-nitrogen hydrolase family protein [Deltaproteobacteria bacterium]|nr:carbon-nitrogen hydrolase family protein [Deltaproteobacteria bacterium]